MRTFRRILSVYFLGLAVLCAAETFVEIRNLLLHRDTPGFYLAVLASLLAVALLGTAGSVLWREQIERKKWVTAASLLNLAIALGPLALYVGLRAGGIRVQPGAFVRPLCLSVIPLAFGIAGLLAFPRESPPAKAAR
jgi:hypothetical protein